MIFEHPIATLTRWFMVGLVIASLFCMNKLPSANGEITDSNAVTIQRPGVVKFDWTTGNLDYKGVNVNADALDGDTDWLIYKFTWVANNPTVIQKRQGSWTGRAALWP